jgi:hypothetical protein
MTRICTSLLALALSLSPAFGESVPADLQGSLSSSVETFEAAIGSGDFGALFDYMPPKVLELLAAQSGMSVDDVLVAAEAQIEAAMETVTFDSFGMDVAAADWQMTPDGALGYAMIPTETVMTITDMGKMKAVSDTIAFQGEDGGWYLVRIDDPSQVTLLQTAYPEFVGVDFPVGSMEMVE